MFRNLLLLIGTSLWLAACHSSSKEDWSILPADLQLQAGDVVFRQGSGLDSRTVMTVDSNSCYSHIGIVVDSAGCPMIVHAVPGEPDFPGDFDRIKMDQPATFFLHSRALIGEVMRPKQQDKAQKAALAALELYHRHIPFDHDYNDEDSTEMYCTELIDFVFRAAGVQLTDAPKSHFDFPFYFHGYLPSQLHASTELRSWRKF